MSLTLAPPKGTPKGHCLNTQLFQHQVTAGGSGVSISQRGAYTKGGMALMATWGVVVLSTSQHFAKIVCNSSSPLYVLSKGSELSLSSEVPTFVQAIASGQPMQIQADMEEAEGRTLGIDCMELLNKAGCTSFVILPLMFAGQAMGALMLAGDDTLNNGSPNQWMASFWPWVAMYVAEVNAIRLVDLLEKIQTAPSLHSLAHVVTNELKCWFEWPLKEETEARLVLLSEDQVSALVLSQPVAVDRGASSLTRTKSQPVPITTGTTRAVTFAGMGTRADDVRLASRAAIPALRRIGEQSADLALSKSAPPSSKSACSPEQDEDAGTLLGQGMRAEAAAALHTDKDGYGGGHEKRQPTSSSPELAEGAGGAASPIRRTASSLSARQSTEGRLLGTQMSLLNTLTRRCLVEGSKLLFVADVMAALKKYGEPWKDIFLDQAQVANPVWVIAAPLASDGIHLGAIVWLSSSRLNPTMLASAAKTSLPPLLHSLADQLLLVTQQATQLRSHNSISAIDEPRLGYSLPLAGSFPCSGQQHSSSGRHLLSPMRCMFSAALQSLSSHLPGCGTGLALAALPLPLVGSAAGSNPSISVQADANKCKQKPQLEAPHTATAQLLHGDRQLHGVMADGVVVTSEGPPLWNHLLSVNMLSPGTANSSMTYAQGHGLEMADFEYKPIKYSVAPSDGASTSALMKVYQTAIAQHQRASSSTSVEPSVPYEEVEVIAKAGQGAFGSVYVAMWRGILVAVKSLSSHLPGFGASLALAALPLPLVGSAAGSALVRLLRLAGWGELGPGSEAAVMKQQMDGRRAMRTAWELAVTKSLQHSNVVAVLNVLTDVLVEKHSKRVIRFVPSTAVDAAITSWSSSMGVPTLSAAIGMDKESQPRCQVIIMEYCNLGPLHHFMAERRFLRPPPVEAMRSSSLATGNATMGPSFPQSHSHSQSQHTSGSSKPSSSSTERTQQPSSATALAVDMPMVIATLSEVAEALQYLHSQGFIHCDLKPENILLKVAPGDNRGFTAKVSDFGLSDLSTSEGLLMGELGGTVTHLDPCIVTQRKVSKKSDVYSFGICMWELYTGQRPYIELLQSSKDKRSRDKLILSKVAHEHKRPVFPPYAPPDFVALATQCWHPDPAARPAFQEVLAELRIMQDRHGYVTASLTIPNGTPALGPL
ncbi:hypothetical protein QJQ45_021085 [Haematococcus lacustris]|nr:hypothetical protein QJQ45_021085 [Haematococcus lacustris]